LLQKTDFACYNVPPLLFSCGEDLQAELFDLDLRRKIRLLSSLVNGINAFGLKKGSSPILIFGYLTHKDEKATLSERPFLQKQIVIN